MYFNRTLALNESMAANNLEGIVLGPNCPPVHSLLFADDLLVCGKATTQEATMMASIIQRFCEASSQTPNWNKSAILFSANVSHAIIQEFQHIFPVPVMDHNFTHLGHPLILPAKNRSAAYNFVLDRFMAKLPTYKANMLSHAARLELIKSVFSAIPVYYMSNILFSKKFIAKLTAIIRGFWWTGIREDSSSRSLCLRAWKDICTSKKEGGLGIRNLQAVNQGLVLAAAWRIAEAPTSFLHLVLKAKYFWDSSFWSARSNIPKSAFWTSILKLLPKLKDHSFYHITQGNISLWSTPWCSAWTNVYDHLIVQQPHFVYPALVKDLWIPGQKTWNVSLITSLFQEPTATAIITTQIIHDDGPDILCWDLSPNGKCTSKSTYKLCLQDIQAQPRSQPRHVPLLVKNILMQVWKQKNMAPRIQTFAWRLLRKALPTGLRAGKFSAHIDSECCRCNQIEDDLHLFFNCPFAKAAWFAHPWYIRSQSLTANCTSLQHVIQALLDMNHPHATVSNIFTFLWCIWKSRNDSLFNRKKAYPHQVYLAATAITESQDFQNATVDLKHQCTSSQLHEEANPVLLQGHTIKSDLLLTGSKKFSDAAVNSSKVPGLHSDDSVTGLGVYMIIPQGESSTQVQIQASCPSMDSPLQAEAAGLLLAAAVAKILQVVRPSFLTDNLTLSKAAATRDVASHQVRWTIRKLLAEFFTITEGVHPQVFHIPRSLNGIAHNVAHQVLNSSIEPVYRCVNSAHRGSICPVLSIISLSNIQGCVIHAVLYS